MRDIKFVSYDGKYPSLCSGTLVLSVDGKDVSEKYCLISGGDWYINKTDEGVSKGDWKLDTIYSFKDMHFTDEEVKYIEKLVNENVKKGCCGGCI